jgi:SulP family sulfate permease
MATGLRRTSNDATVLHYAGVGLFAEVARIDEEWPRADGTPNAVVVLSMRALPDVSSSVCHQGDTALGG